MSNVTRFVGLDYHLDSVQVCVMDASGQVLRNRKVANDTAEIRQAVCGTFRLDEQGRVLAAVESCAGAAHLAEELMQDTTWTVTLAHPGIVSRMKQNPDKSDHADSFILADLMRLGYLPKVWLAPEEIRQLRSLVRYRAQLVKQRTRVKLRVRAMLRERRLKAPEGLRGWTVGWLSWLKQLEMDEISAFLRDEHLEEMGRLSQKITAVEKKLKALTADDAMVKKLQQLEGIGVITAITMRAEIVRFDRFDSGKQLSRYCGVTPRNASSGQKQSDAGLIKAGNPGLRVVLIQAAQRLINYSARWHAFADRLKGQGKPHNVAVAAVANRWLRCLYHQMQPDQLVAA
ncbi:IS110 family RNA-guided transposase [Rubinisphaera brasiliensis]|nr:IS110 family transposase [Rubinisphaera brasiliensis]ADY58822.1 transposase IS116/IS110/IS902 family protein [Rubinisphaera brasiliensis DSM 5305]ADY58954.1 transposase IS116/IS110/IS902 family protein [Rubinisphaera brasiliensis DSM 5305]ADY58971.1 transposase IS116/IS110/IS902 family protein [Rubinisphaera brasiliensis DSM 5305]ADY59016.1 transposase IS116/IS110/IS902 family protein [Rubinisphaera brasiliensis DSM 5305]ADY59757.1 transposase IS116/IS110/IS902 family protein [Rubinisphaera